MLELATEKLAVVPLVPESPRPNPIDRRIVGKRAPEEYVWVVLAANEFAQKGSIYETFPDGSWSPTSGSFALAKNWQERSSS